MEWRRYLSGGLAALSAALVTVALSAWAAAVAPPTLTPSPETVQVGETIGLSFASFTCSAGRSLTVHWDNNPLTVNVVAGSAGSGSFTADAVVPPSPLGPNQVDAECFEGTKPVQQIRGSVNVVALTPSARMVQAGEQVTMTGSGFTQCTGPARSTAVDLSANGTPLATASGANGDFQQSITVPPATVAGPYPVTAQCSAQPGSDLTSTSLYVVTLALAPSSGTPATTISVTGDGYTQCREVQLQLLRDATQAVAAGSAIVRADGSMTAEVTVPSSATPGNDYQVDVGCYPVAGGNALVASKQFTVTPPVTSASPTPGSTSAGSTSAGSPTSSTSASSRTSSTSATSPLGSTSAISSTSPSLAQSGAGSASPSVSPSLFTATSSHPAGRTSGQWVPVTLTGAGGAGLAVVALLLARALSVFHGRRGRGWVNKHLRVTAGQAGPPSANIERRPGAASVSVGLEPHLDHYGNQQYEEVAR
jgi:hypothetical protein